MTEIPKGGLPLQSLVNTSMCEYGWGGQGVMQGAVRVSQESFRFQDGQLNGLQIVQHPSQSSLVHGYPQNLDALLCATSHATKN